MTPFGLVGAGRVAGSFVAQLPQLHSQLGPVAAQSYRLASRIANSIEAGHPVKRYQDLKPCTLILICVPRRYLQNTVSTLAGALDFKNKTVLLCDGGADSGELGPLRERGAAAGSIQVIPGFNGRRFVTEGDRRALREAKRLAAQLGAHVEEVGTGKMAIYNAGLTFASSLFTPLIAVAAQCLEDAGMRKMNAVKVAAAVCQESIRGYVYAGKRSWSGPVADGSRVEIQRELAVLAESKPLLERYYREAAAFALELWSPDSNLIKTLGAGS